jgi:ribonuclease Z
MECRVLGSGGMVPMPRRRLTSVALRLDGWQYLFDCGEGTQVPYKQHHLGLRSLHLMAVTHLHADHCLGLPGMLMLRAQMPDPGALTIVGPPGLERFIRHVRADLAMFINYDIHVREWAGVDDEVAFEDERARLLWRPLNHSVLCLGYRMEEHYRPGKFDSAAADQLGVPWGPLRGKLQQGESIILEDGSIITPNQVLGPTRRGRHMAFITDTTLAPALESLLEGVDLAFLESMFLPEHEEEAVAKKHLTTIQSATIARAAGVKKLVLVHLSPRYDHKDAIRMEEIAQQHHPDVHVARDGEALSLQHND